MTTTKQQRGRGFAALTPAERSRISSMGGIASHRLGGAHEWTREEAQKAGRKGGQAKRRNRSGFREEL